MPEGSICEGFFSVIDESGPRPLPSLIEGSFFLQQGLVHLLIEN